jgi:2-polyprenyl-6-methoxyphenol hydroxylase-like FAD-dependent oxidoreductase
MQNHYDLAIVGGGLAGSALALRMANHGARVLVLERETAFRDRVRGEWLAPWGTKEARDLDLLDIFDEAGAHPTPWNISRSGKPRWQSTPAGDLPLAFSHPVLQERMIEASEAAGATVLRGARATNVSTGLVPSVTYSADGLQITTRAALVVGAEGRGGLSRSAINRREHQHRSERLLAGVLIGNIDAPEGTSYYLIRSGGSGLAMVYPRGDGFARAYVFIPGAQPAHFRGEDGFQHVMDLAVESGVPAEVLAGATQEGPLAAFKTSDSYVETPYRDGVTLVGDAAGVSDPTWGMGVALLLRDAHVLSDELLATDDWHQAAACYASRRDGYFEAICRVEDWQTELLLTPGREQDARRRHTARQWSDDPSRVPDLLGLGSDVDRSEAARRRFFGEDVEREDAPAVLASVAS